MEIFNHFWYSGKLALILHTEDGNIVKVRAWNGFGEEQEVTRFEIAGPFLKVYTSGNWYWNFSMNDIAKSCPLAFSYKYSENMGLVFCD